MSGVEGLQSLAARVEAEGGAVLLVTEPEVAYQILALIIEKTHAVRERALEVVRLLA